KRIFLTLMVLSLLAFLAGASALARQTSGTGQESTAKHATHHAVHHAEHMAHHAAHHVRHMVHHAAAANPEARYQAGVHTLSGTLSTVDPNSKLLVITNSNGIPFDFVVTHFTRIDVNGKRGNLSALADQANQQVTVRYRDGLRRGLMAQSVQLGG
ncbi:MAG: hypothetical protein ACRD3O_08130, partial [Terriglobia bacterium]